MSIYKLQKTKYFVELTKSARQIVLRIRTWDYGFNESSRLVKELRSNNIEFEVKDSNLQFYEGGVLLELVIRVTEGVLIGALSAFLAHLLYDLVKGQPKDIPKKSADEWREEAHRLKATFIYLKMNGEFVLINGLSEEQIQELLQRYFTRLNRR